MTKTDLGAEFEAFIDKCVDVVHYQTAGDATPTQREATLLGQLSRCGYSPPETRRALAYAVKRDRLVYDLESYWIPGRPEGTDNYTPRETTRN